MLRIVNEIGRLVAARMHGDRFIPANDLNPVDISLRQNWWTPRRMDGRCEAVG
jgi:hypothetical protein